MRQTWLSRSPYYRNLLITVIVCSIAAIYILDVTYGVRDVHLTHETFVFQRLLSHYARRSSLKNIYERFSLKLFDYPLEPQVCTKGHDRTRLKVVIYVASGVGEEDRQYRSVVRATWANSTSPFFSVVFLLGIPKRNDPKSAATLQELKEENQQYGDLLQANFEDRFVAFSRFYRDISSVLRPKQRTEMTTVFYHFKAEVLREYKK